MQVSLSQPGEHELKIFTMSTQPSDVEIWCNYLGKADK